MTASQTSVRMSAPNQDTGRIAFIDAIRGFAALLVVLQHALNRSHLLVTGPNSIATSVLDLGEAGVLAFFLVSGFIIPFSLERYGHLGKFWINRAFRIYPLYLLAYAVMAYLNGSTWLHTPGAFAVNFLAHLLLVQDYVGQKNLVGVSWTLSLEAVWYAGFSLLFALGLHRRNRLAVACAVALSALAGTLSLARAGHVPMGRVVLITACLWGLVLYRRFDGSIGRREMAWASAVLLAIIVTDLTIGFLLRRAAGPAVISYRSVLLSSGLGALLFGVPYLTRTRAAWRRSAIAFLGRISYSIYLVHGAVMLLLVRSGIDGFAEILLALVLTIPIATLTYKYIEQPGIMLARRLNASFGAPVAA